MLTILFTSYFKPDHSGRDVAISSTDLHVEAERPRPAYSSHTAFAGGVKIWSGEESRAQEAEHVSFNEYADALLRSSNSGVVDLRPIQLTNRRRVMGMFR